MVVVYALSGTKGFIPCSKGYAKQIKSYMANHSPDAIHLFLQVHCIIWIPNANRTRYTHALKPRYKMNADEYDEIIRYGEFADVERRDAIFDQIKQRDLRRQCPKLSKKQWENRRFLGPQSSLLEKAYAKMIKLQMAINEHYGDRYQIDMSKLIGPGVYAPNPFPVDEHNDPIVRECQSNSQCPGDNVCWENKVCVIPESKRTCAHGSMSQFIPQGTYPEIDANIFQDTTKYRTTDRVKYSVYNSKHYDTCYPDEAHPHGAWIPRYLRKKLGIDFNVKEIRPYEWIRTVQNSAAENPDRDVINIVHFDGNTMAPYYIIRTRAIPPRYIRCYKLNSAYSPFIDIRGFLTMYGDSVPLDYNDDNAQDDGDDGDPPIGEPRDGMDIDPALFEDFPDFPDVPGDAPDAPEEAEQPEAEQPEEAEQPAEAEPLNPYLERVQALRHYHPVLRRLPIRRAHDSHPHSRRNTEGPRTRSRSRPRSARQ